MMLLKNVAYTIMLLLWHNKGVTHPCKEASKRESTSWHRWKWCPTKYYM